MYEGSFSREACRGEREFRSLAVVVVVVVIEVAIEVVSDFAASGGAGCAVDCDVKRRVGAGGFRQATTGIGRATWAARRAKRTPSSAAKTSMPSVRATSAAMWWSTASAAVGVPAGRRQPSVEEDRWEHQADVSSWAMAPRRSQEFGTWPTHDAWSLAAAGAGPRV